MPSKKKDRCRFPSIAVTTSISLEKQCSYKFYYFYSYLQFT